MKSNLPRLYTLLISAGYDKKTFEETVMTLRKTDPKKLIKEFEGLSDALKKLTYSSSESAGKNVIASNDVKNKIYNILIIDSGLSINKCLSLFEEAIKRMYPNRKLPTINSKKGFYASMNALANCFTDSELLHIASKLNKQLKNNVFDDDNWMLKE